MDRRDVESGIHRAWMVVQELGLDETYSNGAPLEVNEEFRDLILSEESTYDEIYLCGLRLSHYNFLLTDYSFFQFSWTGADRVRYAYYPNPFIAGRKDELNNFKRRRELVEAGMITHEEYLSLLRDAPIESRVPVIRYENAPDQHNGLHHPCSHFHIGHHSDNRWALNRILTPLAFALLVLKHYYGSEWFQIGNNERDVHGNIFESRLIEEKKNCRPISGSLFSEAEAKSFFFS